MNLEEIRQRAAENLSADDYRKMSVSDIAQIRIDVKRLLKKIDGLRAQQEQGCEYCCDSDCLEAWLEMKGHYCRHCGRKLDGGGQHDEL